MGAGGNLVGACAFVSEKIQYNFQNRSTFTLPSPVLVEGLKMQEKSCCDLVKLFEVYIQWHLQEVLLNYCAF